LKIKAVGLGDEIPTLQTGPLFEVEGKNISRERIALIVGSEKTKQFQLPQCLPSSFVFNNLVLNILCKPLQIQ
jgi:hypothetical protein